MDATYRREYENFTHLPGESIDALFLRFMVVVNNMRASVATLLYGDHDRAVKLLHLLDRTMWDVSVRNMVPTLTINKRRGLSLNGRC
jgi:hypothetical protein